MKLALLVGVLLMLIAYTVVSSIIASSPSSFVVLDKPSYVSIQGSEIIVTTNATNRVYVATIELQKPALIMVEGALATLSMVPPAYLEAVSVNDDDRYGPASIISLPSGSWRIYVHPLMPGTITLRVTG